jgi:SET domain-containing protein
MRETMDYRPAEWMDPRIEIRPSSIHGKGMFATAPIKQGEAVNIWGGTLLLTEEDLEGKRNEWRAKGYVWSTIGEGLYLAILLGEENKDLTNFINHTCDPNVWMQDEVALVARRDIAVGEELTVDYAMFEGDEDWVGRFECRCGSDLCRGRFAGRDWRRKDLQERYGDRWSPFINERIRRLRASQRGDGDAG